LYSINITGSAVLILVRDRSTAHRVVQSQPRSFRYPRDRALKPSFQVPPEDALLSQPQRVPVLIEGCTMASRHHHRIPTTMGGMDTGGGTTTGTTRTAG
jgi:hypothetical protein